MKFKDSKVWSCKECGQIFNDNDWHVLKSEYGDFNICKGCNSADTMLEVCEEKECTKVSTCGIPTDLYGYLRLCGNHYSIIFKQTNKKEE